MPEAVDPYKRDAAFGGELLEIIIDHTGVHRKDPAHPFFLIRLVLLHVIGTRSEPTLRGNIDTAQMKVAVSHNMAYSYLFVFTVLYPTPANNYNCTYLLFEI